jgi:hypothetical protein
MGLLQKIKTNSSTFHIRTKEEIDQLFRELAEQKLPVDNKMDFYIRMSIQVLKLQLYYELKLVEYRRTINSATKVPCVEANNKVDRKVSQKKTNNKTKKKTSLEEDDERRNNRTKEELIADNKARVAKYHPEPDSETYPTGLYRARNRIKFEKEMKEWNKGHWVSIISIPMK